MTNINRSNDGNNKLKSRIEGLTPEEKDELLEILRQDRLSRNETKLENVHKLERFILKDLRENHTRIEENIEISGYKGKIIYIELPKKGEFEGFNFSYFISNDEVTRNNLLENSKLIGNLYTNDDVINLKTKLQEYLFQSFVKEYGLTSAEADKITSQTKLFKHRKKGSGINTDIDNLQSLIKDYILYRQNLRDSLKEIIGSDVFYRIKDTEDNKFSGSKFGIEKWDGGSTFLVDELTKSSAKMFIKTSHR